MTQQPFRMKKLLLSLLACFVRLFFIISTCVLVQHCGDCWQQHKHIPVVFFSRPSNLNCNNNIKNKNWCPFRPLQHSKHNKYNDAVPSYNNFLPSSSSTSSSLLFSTLGGRIRCNDRTIISKIQRQVVVCDATSSSSSSSSFSSTEKKLQVNEDSDNNIHSTKQPEEIQNDGSFATEDLQMINQLAMEIEKSGDNTTALRHIIMEALPTMSPSLIMKLRIYQPTPTTTAPTTVEFTDEAAVSATSVSSSSTTDKMKQQRKNISIVCNSMNIVHKLQVDNSKETLLELLNAGEIRKLDNLIGKAARDGKLDIAFFNVLAANIQDSVATAGAASASDAASVTIASDTTESSNSVDDSNNGSFSTSNDSSLQSQQQDGNVDRTSILRHIYTRCQEEIEKTIPPGTALLNKLLRTDQQSIRMNLYKHYLLVPETDDTIMDKNGEPVRVKTITTPDGKSIQLKNIVSNTALVDLNEFVSAIDTAVVQIRTMEINIAITNESAAQMVEACRTIAKEARIVIGERYGPNSEPLNTFQEKLQPVFRPTSPNSIYIKGK